MKRYQPSNSKSTQKVRTERKTVQNQKRVAMSNSRHRLRQQGSYGNQQYAALPNSGVLVQSQHPSLAAAPAPVAWTGAEKDFLLFVTKVNLAMTGILLALAVFMVGSRLKQIRTRQPRRVQLVPPPVAPVFPAWEPPSKPHMLSTLSLSSSCKKKSAKRLQLGGWFSGKWRHSGKDKLKDEPETFSLQSVKVQKERSRPAANHEVGVFTFSSTEPPAHVPLLCGNPAPAACPCPPVPPHGRPTHRLGVYTPPSSTVSYDSLGKSETHYNSVSSSTLTSSMISAHMMNAPFPSPATVQRGSSESSFDDK